MRRQARFTALLLVAALAAVGSPMAADAAAPAQAAGPEAEHLHLGDDIVHVPGARLAAPAKRAAGFPTLAAAQDHAIFISVATTSGGSPVTVPTTEAQARTFVQALDDYWSEESGNAVNLTFGGFETRTATAACTTNALFDEAEKKAFTGTFNFGLWQGTFRHLVTLTTTSCAGGLGTLGGNGGLIISGQGTGSLGLPVALHEFGHNLGFAHANGAICATTSYDASDDDFGTPSAPDACEAEEYADFLDIMGYSVSGSKPHLSSPQRVEQGWLTGTAVIDSTTTTSIVPLGEASGRRALAVKDPDGEVYYVELRSPSDPADANSLEFTRATTCETAFNAYSRCWGSTTTPGGVRIVRAIDDPDFRGTSVLAVGPVTGQPSTFTRDTHLDAGETFTNYDSDITITVNSITAAGAEIAVVFGVPAPKTTSTTISLSASSVPLGSAGTTATATVTPASASGSVAFYADADASPFATVPVSGGSATASLPATLSAGAHSVSAAFTSASSAFSSSPRSAPVSLTVVAPPGATPPEKAAKATTRTTFALTSKKVKATKRAVVTVRVSGTRPTGRITVLAKGKKLTAVTLKASAKGRVKITLPRLTKPGTYRITVKYGGSAGFSPSTSKAGTLRIVK